MSVNFVWKVFWYVSQNIGIGSKTDLRSTTFIWNVFRYYKYWTKYKQNNMCDAVEWVTSHFHRAAPCQGRPTAEMCAVRHSFCWRNKWDPKHVARKATLWPCGNVNCWEAVLCKVPVWLMSSPELVTAGGDSSAANCKRNTGDGSLRRTGGVTGCWGRLGILLLAVVILSIANHCLTRILSVQCSRCSLLQEAKSLVTLNEAHCNVFFRDLSHFKLVVRRQSAKGKVWTQKWDLSFPRLVSTV
jgi:hypothetical protein